MEIKISVIMPAYNAEKTIKQAIRSVMRQTFSEWELLVINDGSKDGTEQIILEQSKQDKRIRYIKNLQNLGIAETRNKGIVSAFGQWVAFLDSDDMWEPNKLEEQLRLARQSKAKFIFTGSAFMNQKGKILKYYQSVPNEISFEELLKQNVISCSSVLIEKRILKKHSMASGYLHEDYALWLKILKDEGILAYGINQPLLIYRVSTRSKSGNKGKAAIMQWNVYQHMKLPLRLSVFYFSIYTLRNLKKYVRIWGQLEKENFDDLYKLKFGGRSL